MNGHEADLASAVAAAGKRLKLAALALGLCWCVATCLGLWLLLFVADSLLNLPAGLRLPLALGGAAFSAVALAQRVVLPAVRRLSQERTAVLLERRYGIPENLLINAVQFQDQRLQPAELPFARQTILRSTHWMTRLPGKELWDWNRLGAWAGGAAGVLLLWVACLLLFPRQMTTTGARYLRPLGDVPPTGTLFLKLTPSGDVTVTEGENLDVALEVTGPRGPGLRKPPVLVAQEKADFIQPSPGAGEPTPMTAKAEAASVYLHTFANVQASFAFRAFAGDSYTRSIRVKVRPLPRLKDSVFRLTPPAYTGARPQTLPGPPAALAALPGATVEVGIVAEPSIKTGQWLEPRRSLEFQLTGGRWQVTTVVSNAGAYEIQATAQANERPFTIARGELRLLADNPPEVDFVTEDRNRLVQFGETLKLEVAARDDYGLQHLTVLVRPADQEEAFTVLKRWTYLGPPGNPGPVREACQLAVDPRVFQAGAAYYLEALAADFRPGAAPSRSRPIVLRVKSTDELNLAAADPLAGAFARLKETIARQEKANHLTANLKTYLEEAVQKGSVQDHRRSISDQQQQAKEAGQQTLGLFKASAEGRGHAAALTPLVETQMGAVLTDLATVSGTKRPELAGKLVAVEERQARILLGLLNLLGQLADQRSDPNAADANAKEPPNQPTKTAEERAKELAPELQKFLAAEQRLLEQSRTLLDKAPSDLTEKDQEILGELAREEQQWAKFFEEKLTDFSKLPTQDFADASLAKELNSVFQEIQQAAKELTEKNIELAVPHEQSGLENAKDLMHNLERWLPDTPDNIKWSMEEPLAPTDIALAELPAELEDIVGDLLDKEEAMTQEVEDVTSSWMDSADKGAGWDAMDGPISNMSAKGVTGNRLPNQMEIGGRSGEGRTGRSHGQMVSDTAEGKGGRETPTRLTPSPFEQGSVKDSAKQEQGGATGGGKLSGFAPEGLRGPAPPKPSQPMPRLADHQARIRQQGEALALKLRRYHVPTGDLESSVNAMGRLEQSARAGDGLAVRRSFSRALDALGQAKKVTHAEALLKREHVKLPAWMRDEIRLGVQDGIPKGYEEMTSEYFRALAEGSGN